MKIKFKIMIPSRFMSRIKIFRGRFPQIMEKMKKIKCDFRVI